MIPYRLIALDLDGTTLDSSGRVRPRVAATIHAAREQGAVVALATGRRLETSEPIARELGVTYLILTDGTVVFDLAAEEVLLETSFTADLQRRSIELILAHGLPPLLFESPATAGRVLAGPPELDNPETVSYLGRRSAVSRLSLDELRAASRVVAILGMGSEAVVEELARHGEAESGCILTFWRPTSKGYTRPTVTLAPPETSKGHALLWLAEHLGIPRAETFAIGDHLNDLSLIQMAGLGLAMGNALPEVKAVAAAVLADHDNDGVAEAIERWVLQDPGSQGLETNRSAGYTPR